ncbi:MAG: hypothetical protein JSV32_06520 [Dehalococcoidia bacterium]|nr:MAG: hypothetical protein JSV32_06520 [Dehalococcoidia bacterium]
MDYDMENWDKVDGATKDAIWNIVYGVKDSFDSLGLSGADRIRGMKYLLGLLKYILG